MPIQAIRYRGGVVLLREYLSELSKLQLLSPSEEQVLWRAFKDHGCRESRQRLIESYQPLVLKIALPLATEENLCAELIQEGTLGLIEAVENYLPSRETRFSTFARHRIRGRMLDFLRRSARSGIALELAHWEGQIEETLASIQDDRADIHEEMNRRAVSGLLRRALERLSVRERQIIEGVYLDDRSPQEFASRLGISASYLYKTQKRALRRLRGLLAKDREEFRASG